ncbi:MAG: NUDIX hydrolase [Leptospira sp.]|nr:NUDIX hydrolase [Leptospira sp.]
MSDHGSFQITQKAFLRNNDKLLVMRDRKSGLGDLPGGRMNEDEFFEDWLLSLRRELTEELGNKIEFVIRPEPILIHRHRVTEGGFPCIIIGYNVIYLGGEIIMSDEHDFMEWVSLRDYKAESLFSEFMLEAINIYKNKFEDLPLK